VEPGAVVTLTGDTGIKVEDGAFPSFSEATLIFRLCIIGFRILDGSYRLNFHDTDLMLMHCISEVSLVVTDCHINYQSASMYNWEAAVDVASLRTGEEPSSIVEYLHISNSRVYMLIFESAWCRSGRIKFISCATISADGIYGFIVTKNTSVSTEYCYAQCPLANAIQCYGQLTLDYFYFESCVNAIYMKIARGEIHYVDGNASNISGHVLRMAKCSSLCLDDTPACSGVTGDIYFESSAATETYPTAGNSKTDSNGSFVVR